MSANLFQFCILSTLFTDMLSVWLLCRAQRISKKSSSIREDGKDEDVFEEEPLEFLSLDDVVEDNMADNIDLQEDWDGDERPNEVSRPNSTTQQRAALRFAFSLGNSAAVPAPSTSMDIPSVDNPRINGSDFRMNSCFLSPSGALMLGSSLDLMVQPLGSSLRPTSQPQLTEPKSSESMDASATFEAADAVEPPLAARVFDHGDTFDHSFGRDDGDDDDDRGDADNRDWIRPEYSVIDEQDVSSSIVGDKGNSDNVVSAKERLLSVQDRQVLKEIVDPWTMHDPHSPGSLPARPFSKGKTFRMPTNLSKTKSSSKKSEETVAKEMLAGVALLDLDFGLNKPFLPEFSYIFEEEARKKQMERLKTRKDRIIAAAARGGVVLDASQLEIPSDENGDGVDDGGLSNRDRDDFGTDNLIPYGPSAATIGFSSFVSLGTENANDDDDDEDEDEGDGDDELRVTYGDAASKSIGDLALGFSSSENSNANRWDYGADGDDRDRNGEEGENGGWENVASGLNHSGEHGEQWMSYEEHCKLRLEEYFRSAQQHMQETELSSRIDEWSQKLTPLLEAQESRPAFDIQQYGTKLIQSFHIESEEVLKEAPRPVMQTFTELFKGSPTYEVSRTFSSMLQLANMGNVKIIPQRNKEGLHDITLQLLSTVPGVDIDNITRNQVPYDDEAIANRENHNENEPSTTSKATQSRPKAKKGASNAKSKARSNNGKD